MPRQRRERDRERSGPPNEGSLMAEPRALVTGAAGFIGSHLVERLLREGVRVTGVDCFTDYADPALKRANLAAAQSDPRFTLLELDLASADLSRLPEVDV